MGVAFGNRRLSVLGTKATWVNVPFPVNPTCAIVKIRKDRRGPSAYTSAAEHNPRVDGLARHTGLTDQPLVATVPHVAMKGMNSHIGISAGNKKAGYEAGRTIAAYGAEEGTRTPTGVLLLDPEPSASANSATSAYGMFLTYREKLPVSRGLCI